MTLTDAEIETKAREWNNIWWRTKGGSEISWQALVRHVLAQSAPRPEDVHSILVVMHNVHDHGDWPSQKWMEAAARRIFDRYGTPPPIAPTPRPEDVGAVKDVLETAWNGGPYRDLPHTMARAIIARYGPPPPIAPAPETRDAEALAQDWYECRWPGNRWVDVESYTRTMEVDAATRFLALPHRAPSPLPVGTIVVGKGLTEAQNTLLNKAAEADLIDAAATAIHQFNWRNTDEGWRFWDALNDRLSTMAYALRASAAPKPPKPPEPIEPIPGVTVSCNIGVAHSVVLTGNINSRLPMCPDEARALAAALNAAADASEGKAAP